MKTKEQYREEIIKKDEARIKNNVLVSYRKRHPKWKHGWNKTYKARADFRMCYDNALLSDSLYQEHINDAYLENPAFLSDYEDYRKNEEEKERIIQEKEKEFKAGWNKWKKQNFSGCINAIINSETKKAKDKIERRLTREELSAANEPLNEKNYELYVEGTRLKIERLTFLPILQKYSNKKFITDRLCNNKALVRMADECEFKDLRGWIDCRINKEQKDKVKNNLTEYFSAEKIEELIEQNPRYTGLKQSWQSWIEKDKILTSEVLSAIPEDITALFPLARKKKRRFILHIGPTNSGKTYEALKDLKRAKNGVYLAPLRLMAYETFETLTHDGVICQMETGEEKIEVPGAAVTSSTIELLNISSDIDIAVIDEAQMISDEQRGGAWTSAILGVNADIVHVCMAENASEIVISLIKMCRDTFEIKRHRRMVPIECESTQFHFPKSVQKGDALIVFGRFKAIACASDLQRRGYKCSVIYGALPYEARHEEVRKFSEGETQVLVATDAIGMGMNIPIRRIVFLENSKFDGKAKRPLNGTEIKQIAGRAGRYGLYDTGYYNAEFGRKEINSLYDKEEEQINKAMLGFPRRLADVDGRLSEIIEKWMGILPGDIFEKSNLTDMYTLAKWCEERTDDKELVYELATVPIDTEVTGLVALYQFLAQKVIDAQPLFDDIEWSLSDPLDELEFHYKEYDLLYNFVRKFGEAAMLESIAENKRLISNAIIDLLKKQRLNGKVCSLCGKPVAWNFPYRICERCYHNLHY